MLAPATGPAWKFLLFLSIASVAVCRRLPGPQDCDDELKLVFSMTNSPAPDGNEVLAYLANCDGSLDLWGAFPTEGNGGIAGGATNADASDPLGSQASLIVHQDRCLFAVNAGSDTFSSFHLSQDEDTNEPSIEFKGVYPSGGFFPVSLTAFADKVYVLNAGLDGSISGYRFASDCTVQAIPNSIRSLGQGQSNPPFFVTSPAQIRFTPTGNHLLVTLKGPHEIWSYAFNKKTGLPANTPVINDSVGNTPFGFDFDTKGHVFVTEAFGPNPVGTPNSAAVSSYTINSNGGLTPISLSVRNFQTAACWLVYWNGQAVTTNNLSGSISIFDVSQSGTVTLANGVAFGGSEEPSDFVIDGDLVYVKAGGTNVHGTLQPSIETYVFGDNDTLERVAVTEEGLPLGVFRVSGSFGLAFANLDNDNQQ